MHKSYHNMINFFYIKHECVLSVDQQFDKLTSLNIVIHDFHSLLNIATLSEAAMRKRGFTKFTGKQLYRSAMPAGDLQLYLKETRILVFPVNFCKNFRSRFF